MRYTAVALVTSALLSTPLQAKERAEAPVFLPSSPWHLDVANEKCRLARRFGEGASEHMLFMELDKPTAAVDFAVAGPALGDTRWKKPVGFRFGTLDAVYEEHYSKGTLGKFDPAILTISTSLAAPGEEEEDHEEESWIENVGGLSGIPAERYAGNEDLHVVQGDKTLAALRLDSLVPALTALNQCAESFVEHWGLDLAQHRTMQQGPRWTNSKAVIRRFISEYPSEALRSGEQGSVRFVVIVDETGAPVECRQSDATEMEKLDSPACKGMMRATFEPALDAEGKPMRSYYATKVRYVLP